MPNIYIVFVDVGRGKQILKIKLLGEWQDIKTLIRNYYILVYVYIVI